MTRLIADNNLNAQARTPNPASSIQDMLVILQSLQVQLLVNRIFDPSTPRSTALRPTRPYCPIRTPEQICPLKGNHTSRFSPPKLSMHACGGLRCAAYFIPTPTRPSFRPLSDMHTGWNASKSTTLRVYYLVCHLIAHSTFCVLCHHV